MFYHDGKLQYKVKVEKPNPLAHAQKEQVAGGGESIKEKVKDWLD